MLPRLRWYRLLRQYFPVWGTPFCTWTLCTRPHPTPPLWWSSANPASGPTSGVASDLFVCVRLRGRSVCCRTRLTEYCFVLSCLTPVLILRSSPAAPRGYRPPSCCPLPASSGASPPTPPTPFVLVSPPPLPPSCMDPPQPLSQRSLQRLC